MNWDLVTIFTFVIILAVVRNHYKLRNGQGGGQSGGQGGAGLGSGDQQALSSAMDVARRLEQRVETLERLLDEDAPGWRARARA